MAAVYSEGTVKGVDPEKFDAEDAAKKLQKAMKGLGTDEKVIIKVLADHNNLQRQLIKDKFKAMFGKDLAEELKGELGGHFLTLALYLLMPARFFDAFCLHSAMNRMGTKEILLIDILASRTASELKEMKEYYKKDLFGHEAEEDLEAELSGDLKHVLVGLLQGQRSEEQTVDEKLVEKDFKDLRKAGVKSLGTDESVFNRILVIRSIAHLRQVFAKYLEEVQSDIEKDIEKEMSGDTREAFLALVRWVKDPIKYYARCFHETFAGPGTDDERLMQLIVSHCEVDLKDVGDAYLKDYLKGLPIAIMDETTGDYQKLLVRLANPQ